MTKKNTSGNPLLDSWIEQQKEFLQFQSGLQEKWLETNKKIAKDVDASGLGEQAQNNWKICEEQFKTWQSLAEKWFGQIKMNTKQGEPDILKAMVNPQKFMSSSMNEIHQAVKQMINLPDFADAGVLEKLFLKSSDDWLNVRDASSDYQAILAESWMNTYKNYVQDVNRFFENKPEEMNFQSLMDHWLKLANEEMINVQRSDDFLKAQNKLVDATAKYKLTQRELMESWCEMHDIPTRTEVDDLHKIVHDLRKQVRDLKRQTK